MLLLDTSALLAGYDGSDRHHAECLRVLRGEQRKILSPFVLAELDYLLFQARGAPAERVMLGDVAQGAYELATFGAGDVENAMRVIERYAALEIGLADASIIVLAERYECLDVLTLDQRHFRAMTGTRGRPFRLLPFDE